MAILGTNVSKRGEIRANEIASIYPGGLARFVLTPSVDLDEYFAELLNAGITPVAVIANESFEEGIDRRLGYSEAARLYFDWYWQHLRVLQVGNEWDHSSDSSWTLGSNELYNLVGAFWEERQSSGLQDRTRIILGGAVSGDPNFLDTITDTLPLVDGISIHPYGQRANGVPAPSGNFGDAEYLIQRYKDKLLDLGQPKPIYVTEWGVSSDEVGEDAQADYCENFASMLRYNSDVVAAMHFCHHEYAGFGEYRPDGSVKPVQERLRRVASGQNPFLRSLEGNSNMAYEFKLGIKTKAEELRAKGIDVGTPLENETYPYENSPYSYQFTTKGKFEYSKTANRAHFFLAAGE